MGNSIVDLDGDAAHIETKCIANLSGSIADEPVMIVRGLRYVDDMARTPSGWQVARRDHLCDWMYRVRPEEIPPSGY
jgi:hypothetical protein